MNETLVLTPERILEVTEDVLRRFGLAKATVVDVARALDVSHGSVYRHFPSKASLRDAVAKRWLDRANAPLEKIAEGHGPGAGTAGALAAHDVLDQAQEGLRRSRDVRNLSGAGAGSARGGEGAQGPAWSARSRIFCPTASGRARSRLTDVEASARAVFDATSRFHHPAHAEEWSDPALPARIDALLALLLKSLEAPRKR